MSEVAERANVAPGDRQPAAHETLNAFCAKGCVAALADSSPATEQEHRVMVERELLRAEVITIAPWLTQVQRRALSLQASFPPPERVDCDEVLSSLFRAKLPLHEVMTAMLGPAVAGGITAALCGMGPINVSASIEATLGAVILNVLFSRHGARRGMDELVAFIRDGERTVEKMMTLLLRVAGVGRDEVAANFLFVASYENFVEQWGFKPRAFDVPARPARAEGVSSVDLGVVVAVMYTAAGIKKELWNADLWAERTVPLHRIQCVPPVRLTVPTGSGYKQIRLQWDFAATCWVPGWTGTKFGRSHAGRSSEIRGTNPLPAHSCVHRSVVVAPSKHVAQKLLRRHDRVGRRWLKDFYRGWKLLHDQHQQLLFFRQVASDRALVKSCFCEALQGLSTDFDAGVRSLQTGGSLPATTPRLGKLLLRRHGWLTRRLWNDFGRGWLSLRRQHEQLRFLRQVASERALVKACFSESLRMLAADFDATARALRPCLASTPAPALTRGTARAVLSSARRVFTRELAAHSAAIRAIRRQWRELVVQRSPPIDHPAAQPPRGPASNQAPRTWASQLDVALRTVHLLAPTSFRLLESRRANHCRETGSVPAWVFNAGPPVLIGAFDGPPDAGHLYNLWWHPERRVLEVADVDPMADLPATEDWAALLDALRVVYTTLPSLGRNRCADVAVTDAAARCGYRPRPGVLPLATRATPLSVSDFERLADLCEVARPPRCGDCGYRTCRCYDMLCEQEARLRLHRDLWDAGRPVDQTGCFFRPSAQPRAGSHGCLANTNNTPAIPPNPLALLLALQTLAGACLPAVGLPAAGVAGLRAP